jgi:hypothetical protein
MNKWTLKSLGAAAVGLLTLAGSANAAVSYSYTTDQANYDATPGTPVTVKLYLLETLTQGSTSVINADGGMLGVGMRVTRSGGQSALGPVTFNGTDFAGPTNVESTAATARFTEAIAAQAGTPGVKVNNGGAANQKANGVYLGTVSVTGGTDPGVTTFALGTYDNLGGNSLTLNNFYDVDFTSANPAFTGASAAAAQTFTVTVVPEPTFAGIALVAGAAGTMIRRRRPQA